MTINFNGTNGITFPDSTTQNTGAFNGGLAFRNRIINGGMDFAQRGTSFSTPVSGTYTLDRWFVNWAGAAPASVAQVAGPTGFRKALQITGAASNTAVGIIQRIESYNCSDLSGANITIQANIAVSSAQTVLWTLYYPTAQDNYASSTLISSGTWSATTTATTFTATITGLPSGATNGLQLAIYPNNAGAFTSGTITITGVQLEKGSTATAFDYRPYGTELVLCQRYYEKSFDQAVVPAANINQGRDLKVTYGDGSGDHYVQTRFSVAKRATPTIVVYSTTGAGSIQVYNGSYTGAAAFAIGAMGQSAFDGYGYTYSANSISACFYSWTSSAEL